MSSRLRERSPGQQCAPCECSTPAGGRRRGRQALGIALVALSASLAGCASLSYEPAAAPAAKGDARTYVVRKGDTLFKIAWQHGLDQRDLVRWNGIKDPNVIHVGQRLRLAPASAPDRRAAASRAARPAAPRAGGSGSAAKQGSGAAQRTPPAAPAPAVVLPAPAWAWPTDGAIVTRFGSLDGIGTGIGIRGSEGQPVRAAAAGRVVYAGSGLMSYGQLLIIKHNDTYLSAYGFNSRLLVAQGQDVTKGQTIAAMGLSPQREPRLHFEIRRNGVPVDPLLLLSAPR